MKISKNKVGFNSIILNNINLGNDTFNDRDSETINHFRIVTWYNRFKQHKACEEKIDGSMTSNKSVALVYVRI